MSSWKTVAAAVGLVAMLTFTQTPAQPGDKKADGEATKDTTPKPLTHKVEKKLFKIELSAKGVLESDGAGEIAYRPSPIVGLPYSAGPLMVQKVSPHGSKVTRGDVLVSFDTRKIDQAIGQVQADLLVLQAGIKVAEEEQPLVEKNVPVEMETAERAKHEADEDLAYFLKTGRPEGEKRANMYLKFATFSLEYAKEQLRQLEKMYKSNDLTEDTEQIILKRQRFMVEDAIYEHKVAALQHDYVLKTTLPRREQSLRDGAVKNTAALDKARATLSLQAAQKQKSLLKMRFDRDRLSAGLDMLHKDRKAMTLLAPTEGVVYFGRFHAGRWDGAEAMAGKLVPDGTVSPDEVLLTVVKTRPLFVRLQIDEKDVHLVKPGLAGRARVAFTPDAKVPAKVTRVAAVPTTPGKFEALVALDVGDNAAWMPGMVSTVRFVPYSVKEAIVVPSAAVHDEDDGYVVEVLRDGKREQRRVTPGRTHDGQTEILDGLQSGEEIFLERAAAKKSTKGGNE